MTSPQLRQWWVVYARAASEPATGEVHVTSEPQT
eukprot:CAMPEP_0181219408 /NCGR_PEP_ID=MMETSP1096-20121128/28250_1 /TAXON_ID=156174 ORGANISM="Chrysochromulina ericina, Strain CCMP281" /NCGR_SAMPLE_ID=MMETSP1096 /ASSEMBLY_ACC=CAM_ASM_000453 /LENGTH=33 /DNA_ID= /DNA_START= /DNA_END= /DNA_ORIENTATION=